VLDATSSNFAFDENPPTGICSDAQSDGVVFDPLAYAPFPPSLEPFTGVWKCEAGVEARRRAMRPSAIHSLLLAGV
jgi:hypothetical protein